MDPPTTTPAARHNGRFGLRRARVRGFVIGLVIAIAALLGTATPVAQAVTGTPCPQTGAETVATDQARYAPGSLVHMTGAGYAPGCDVVVKVTRPDGSVVTGDGSNTPGSDTVSTDLFGGFSYDYQLQSVPAISGTYIVDVLGTADTVLAHATFEDALTIKGDVMPTYVPGSSTLTFRTLVRNTSSDTAISQVNVDLPGTYTAAAVAGSAFSSGTWAAATAPSGFDFAFVLTGGTALATSTGWARIDITATTPVLSSGGGATLRFQGCGNVGCGGGNSTRDTDSQAFVLVDATPPTPRYTADFRDGSNNVTTPLLTNGVAASFRLRITSTAVNNSTKYTVVALPACFNINSSPAVILTGGAGYNAPLVRDGFIILAGGNLGSVGNFMTVQFTATPTGCADGALAFLSSVSSNQNDDSSGTNQVVAISGAHATVTMDSTPPTVTIDQAGAQPDPTKSSPINFTAAFSEPVTGFSGSDVTITGTAGGTKTATVTGGPSVYNVAVSGMTSDGTVVASIPAGAAQDSAANPSAASTSTDNTVTYDMTGPVTSNGAVSATPTNTPPTVTATATDALSGVAAAEYFIDVTGGEGSGTAMAASDGDFDSGTEAVTATLTLAQFSALGEGPHSIFIRAKDDVEAGNWGAFESVAFVKDTVKPEVTIDQASGQADPAAVSPIHFTAVFDEPVTGFASTDVAIAGTAGGTKTVTVTEIAPSDGTTYDVAVSGMAQRGTVVATIPAMGAQDAAGNGNNASTATDNSVVWDRVPAAGVTLSDHSPKTNDILTATATPSDPDGDSVTLTYVWKVNGTTKQTAVTGSTTDSFNLAAAGFGDTGDSITVTVTPNDGLFDGSSASDSATVVNSEPTVSLSGPGVANEGSSPAYAFAAADDDGDALSFAAGYPTCGSGGSLVGAPTVAGGSFQCSFTDGPGGSVVAVKVEDSDGAPSDEATVSVSIRNVDPIATLGNDGPVDEGSASTVSFSAQFDPSSADTAAGFRYAYSCSNGDLSGATYAASGTLASQQCTFDDGPADHTVKARIIDKDGGFSEYTTVVRVRNVDPTVHLTGPASADEGQTKHYSFTTEDPGDEVFGLDSASCGAGNSRSNLVFDAATGVGSFDCLFPDGPLATGVSVSVNDGDGGSGSASQPVAVANVAPRVSLTGPNEADEGDTETYVYTVNDPGQDSFSVAPGYPSCGTSGSLVPGSSLTTAAGGSFDCHFPDGPQTTTVAIKVQDDDGAMSVADTEAVDIIEVAIANVAPSLVAPANQSAAEGTSKSFALGSFADDGVDDAPWTVSVDWGDGSPAESFTTNSQGAISGSHAYADNGTYVVQVKVTDKDHASSATKTFEVTVANLAPSLSAPADQTADEGTGKSFDLGSFSDAGADDGPWSVAVNWGDGSSESFTTAGQGAIARSHTYDDNGPYAVSVTVTDKDGDASDQQTFDVVVANVPPTATFNAPSSVDEGSAIAMSLTDATDVSSSDRNAGFTYAFDCGSGYGAFSGDSTASCSTNDSGTQTVKGIVRDKDGGQREYAKDVTVNNVAPSATFNAPSSVAEGSSIDVSLTDPSDPSSADVAAGFMYAFDCGDGSGYGAFTTSSSRSCPTTDNGLQTVKGKIRDKDLGEREYTKEVAVGNLPPQVTVTSPEFGKLYAKPANVAMTASFTDAGRADTHTCSFNWDDGTSSAGTVAEANGAGTCSGTHTFANAGVYTIKVTVTDDDGAATTVEWMVVVYDPNAGFITGGGWIDVAPGSYTADPMLSGRANFGFNSQYKKGASVPTGETEFNFQVAGFKFHSSQYEYLVVSGYKAQYKGTGAVNGVPGYSFRLTAYDGALTNPKGPDRFRIKVMDAAGQVVFDNRVGRSDDLDLADPQAISVGSIVIHKA